LLSEGGVVSMASDVWACGLCICEAAANVHVFYGMGSEQTQLVEIFKLLGSPTTSSWPGVDKSFRWTAKFLGFIDNFALIERRLADHPGLSAMIRQMLELNPARRPTVWQLLRRQRKPNNPRIYRPPSAY
jgi:serine/threonine protein kinase